MLNRVESNTLSNKAYSDLIHRFLLLEASQLVGEGENMEKVILFLFTQTLTRRKEK